MTVFLGRFDDLDELCRGLNDRVLWGALMTGMSCGEV